MDTLEKDNYVDVHISDGILRGKQCRSIDNNVNYYSFTGIPYAEPPVGELRFKPPQPAKKWTGTKDVTKNEDMSYLHYDIITRTLKGLEELVINVYTPSISKKEKKRLPVMVNIHYGGYFWGSGGKMYQGPEYLIEKDVLLVTFNYRLGVLGFLCLDIPECPGNAGLKDQVLALQWVQNNIACFNGDPNNVTIFGASAGAAAVGLHLLSPMSSNKFHKAISHSGSALAQWTIRKNPVESAFNIARILGLNSNRVEEVLPFLNKLSSRTILNASLQMEQERGVFLHFTPVVEKVFDNTEAFLISDPLTILSSGEFKKCPTMVGFCDQEEHCMRLMFPNQFNNIQKDLDPESYIDINFGKELSENIRAEIFDTYKFAKENWYLPFFRDLDIASGIIVTANYLSKENPEVYVFNFTYNGSFKYSTYRYEIEKDFDGVTHLDDLGYIFSTNFSPKREYSSKDLIIKDRMVTLWTNFSKFGNPTPDTNHIIPTKWTNIKGTVLDILEIGDEMKMEAKEYEKRKKLWDFIYSLKEEKNLINNNAANHKIN